MSIRRRAIKARVEARKRDERRAAEAKALTEKVLRLR